MDVEVVAAIFVEKGEILCMQRKKNRYHYLSYKYEFPGGKLEEGESREQALERELMEEMDLDLRISPREHFTTVEHHYPDFRLVMHCYLLAMDGRKFVLKEHQAFEWMKVQDLKKLDWAAADLPVVEQLMEVLG